MSKKYTAITVGPIFDTLSLAATPGALWTASYMFSYLVKNICAQLVAQGLPEENIVSPYYTEDSGKAGYELMNKRDGVGLFHDRVIFSHEGAPTVNLQTVKDNALADVIRGFGFDDKKTEFFSKYVLMADVTYESDSPIFDGGDILDCLELSKPFVPRYTTNPILSVFTGRDGHQNADIKKLPLVKELDNWQLIKERPGDNIILKRLSDISSCMQSESSITKKRAKYYAIVRADGDNISTVIKALGADGDIRDFSLKCLKYCSEIAEIVQNEYNGVTVYAGGDDLLAILPCYTDNTKTVLSFIDRANTLFKESFIESSEVSLSFGVSICYHTFPLYEALDESAALLFGTAKSEEHGKNCAAIRLHKHSGQSAGLVIKNGEALSRILKLQKKVLAEKGTDEAEDILFSSLHKLSLFETAFAVAGSDVNRIKNLFKNTFDAAYHDTEFITKTLPVLFADVAGDKLYIKALSDENEHDEKEKALSSESVLAVCSVLRILKFFTEKAGEGRNG